MSFPEKLQPIQKCTDFLPYVANGQYRNMSMEQLEQIVPWSLDKFNLRDFQIYLTAIAHAFGGDWEVFRGLKCLDICCGSNDGEGFYPWLPPILSTLGAEVTGLDLGTQPEELNHLYTHISYDITKLDNQGLHSIQGIGDKKFDLITFLNTINSFVPSDVLSSMAWNSDQSLKEIQRKVLKNIPQLLNSGGVLCYDSLAKWQIIYKKP